MAVEFEKQWQILLGNSKSMEKVLAPIWLALETTNEREKVHDAVRQRMGALGTTHLPIEEDFVFGWDWLQERGQILSAELPPLDVVKVKWEGELGHILDDGLFGPGIQPHHCDLTNMDGIVTVTPRSFDAETYVDGQHIAETIMLQSGMNIQFGSSHMFKFVDPSQNHMSKRPMDAGPMVKGQRIKSGQGSRSVQETTFDLDGDIHSGVPLTLSKSSDRLDSEHTASSSSSSERNVVKPIIRVEQQDYYKQEIRPQEVQGHELILPATIEFRESSEDAFLSAVVNYTNSSTVHFKLSPTYVLYMTCRYVLSSQYRLDMSPSERTHKVIAIVNKMVSMMEGVIQDIAQYEQKQKNIAGALAFWMANASELLNFIKQDRDLSRITLDAQDVLAHLVQMAFKYLVHCLQSDLNNYMPAFLEDPEEASPERPKIDDVLHTLTGAMSLLRRCRVNAALTIQLFSQLFHFINMWLFNKLVTEPDSCLCSHYWGAIIRQQLGHIEAWAEKQGLELAADCHLSRIVQATTLLTMDKYLAEDVSNINNTCFKLNSLQLQALLQSYHCAQDEPYIPQELIENVVALAENTADELARSDGREVQLEEDPDLQLPFLLPEDGYSCDVVRNIPNGLQEFLEPLCQRGNIFQFIAPSGGKLLKMLYRFCLRGVYCKTNCDKCKSLAGYHVLFFKNWNS
ncbi:afadin-like [Scyliorhinus torazame]|uniref:afadin-like n=1 Tax=Scyliorhinus torazame TaxID=75743 RepID=UPI003B5A6A01